MLSDKELYEMCINEDASWKEAESCKEADPGVLITPFDPLQIGPASIDLTIDSIFVSPDDLKILLLRDGCFEESFIINKNTQIDTKSLIKSIFNKKDISIEVILQPRQVIKCQSIEYIRIPPNAIGTLYTRSSFARDWLNHSTATLLNPGFSGNITFELINQGPDEYKLKANSRPIHMAIQRLSGICTKPYYAQKSAKYQRQKIQLDSLMKEG